MQIDATESFLKQKKNKKQNKNGTFCGWRDFRKSCQKIKRNVEARHNFLPTK